ncbi:MAG: hypothetical protein ABW039_11175 [Sphingobium sp.]
MATQAAAAKAVFEREHRFFFIMACIMAFVLVAGFSTSILFARSSFGAPLIVHVHAFVFFGWVVLYLAQTGLVATGSVALHKRLGWLALAWVPAMVVMGFAITLHTIRATGGPFFFGKSEFLVSNPMGILTFAGLVFAAIALRRRTDWHRRLMFCAMASITGPGFGRLLPMPFLIPWAWWIAGIGVPAILFLVGMIADHRRMGRVHAAYLYGLGTFIGVQVLASLFAFSAAGYALADSVTAGTPGAARPMQAFLPPDLIP